MKRYLLVILILVTGFITTSCVTIPSGTDLYGKDTSITFWNRTPTSFGIYIDGIGVDNNNGVVYPGKTYTTRIYSGSHRISLSDLGANADNTGQSIAQIINFVPGGYNCRITSSDKGFAVVYQKK